MSPVVVTLALWIAAQTPEQNPFPTYESLAQGPLRMRRWGDYPFIFVSYGGAWDASGRVAQEFRAQQLLTPTWDDPDFVHPLESSATEWGWNVRPDASNRADAYAWMRALVLDKMTRRAHSNDPMPVGEPFYTLTGHSWYSIVAAQLGGDLIGLETGENIIAMQAQIAFLRGAARQNERPFYVQPSQWFGGTVPHYEVGEDEYAAHELDTEAVLKGIASGGIRIPNGGHAPSLLQRMWVVGWLSGAAIVCPEACQSNFFVGTDESNWGKPFDERIPLSPIGERAKAFFDVTRAHPDIGVPYAPFGVVLDEHAGFNGFPLTQPRPWNVLEPTWQDREISLFWETAFPKSMYLDFLPGVDEELADRRLVASPFGDSFDTLVSNAPQKTLDAYPVLFCVGGHRFEASFVQALEGYLRSGGTLYLTRQHALDLGAAYDALEAAGNVRLYGIDPNDLPDPLDSTRWHTPAHWGVDEDTLKRRKAALAYTDEEVAFMGSVRVELSSLAATYLPVRVDGEVETLVNRLPDGWLVGLVNNNGVTKGRMTAVRLDPTQEARATIRVKTGRVSAATEWTTQDTLTVDDSAVSLTIPPGEVRIVAFRVE
ncbi:MAG: hypothetical protein O3A46_09005 [Candidatus Poribacteria bacterium]|nr:hypothetical protein [Candidatus Poribacteria bacterium]